MNDSNNAFKEKHFEKNHKKKNNVFDQVNALCHKSITTMVNMHELGIVLFRFGLQRLLPVCTTDKLSAGKKFDRLN